MRYKIANDLKISSNVPARNLTNHVNVKSERTI